MDTRIGRRGRLPGPRHPLIAMKIYRELADWWPMLSAPDDYREEAEFFQQLIEEAGGGSTRTILELGSGGGNNASHLKHRYTMTLVDPSPEMLAASRALNRECAHFQGDMRSVRLGRQFDAVFIHDAIMYMTTESDLGLAIETAYSHCRAGGVALFVPDYTRETFAERTDQGGEDRDGLGLRYLEWTYDPEPYDTTYVSDFAIILREANGATRVVHDRHVQGLFSRVQWQELIRRTGFDQRLVRDPWSRVVFVANRAT